MPIADIKRMLSYDEDTGVIRWISSPRLNVAAGAVAGCIDPNGYRIIRLGNSGYRAHRIAWVLHYGVDPGDKLDHRNRNRDDNRIVNLRKTTNGLNKHNSPAQKNNACGEKGVMFCQTKKKWRARIMVDGRRVHLGRFDTKEEASESYKSAAERMVGEYAYSAA